MKTGHDDGAWRPVEPDSATALERLGRPLEALASGRVPAIVLRGAYPREACGRLYRRLIERGHLHDPDRPLERKFVDAGIPEGHYREGREGVPRGAWEERLATGKLRIDVGTSLGYRGSDQERFFAHAAETRALFATLFDGLPHPIQLMHRSLAALSVDKHVATAHEPDGREYGPAIIRAHYGGYAYRPHFDSVRLRERRVDYAVHRFDHQFAGVLVLTNSEREGRTAQCTLHRYLWQPEVQPYLDGGTFPEFARQRGIGNVEVCLEPGDLYFFNTRLIHEVPGVDGILPRVVRATFIGFSAGDDEIFVWS